MWRQNSGKKVFKQRGKTYAITLAPAGSGDLAGLVVGDGTLIEIECKASKGKARKAQEERHEALNHLGAIHLFANSKDGLDAAMASISEAIVSHRIRSRAT